ncbi:hypothetical protein [Ensifer aridi]|uniref:hypothetical protein n=1 Tax=Ensifer aridi TaxID=1708715 RepID=UPI00111C5497|nr:hypothetical protein [Ensifer aridi]
MRSNRIGRRWHVSTVEANFLKSEIECGIPARAKRALQTVCHFYRNGGTILPAELNAFENSILGALNSGASDEKVRRWSLSALSNLGRLKTCWTAILDTIARHSEEPQVVSAAIAALFKLDLNNAQAVIATQTILPPELVTLSALQTRPPTEVDTKSLRIDIENADPTTLKLALVLVGLNKSPEHIFHPRFTNPQIVKVLGSHHEPLVSQYSAWATAESPVLSASDLGIDLKTLDSQPDNVRSYVYRLYGAERTYSTVQHELIAIGSKDTSVEARLGLAIGLRDTWYNGLDTITLDWHYEETDEEVRDFVLDHIVAQAEQSSGYRTSAIEIYQASAADMRKRQRMEAASFQTELRKEFRRMAHQEEEGLFGNGGTQVTNNNTFINNGTVNQATQSGDINNSQNAFSFGQVEQARTLLGQVRHELDIIHVTPATEDAKKAIVRAQETPNKDTLGAAVGALKKVQEGLSSVAGTAETAVKIAGILTPLAALLA